MTFDMTQYVGKIQPGTQIKQEEDYENARPFSETHVPFMRVSAGFLAQALEDVIEEQKGEGR